MSCCNVRVGDGRSEPVIRGSNTVWIFPVKNLAGIIIFQGIVLLIIFSNSLLLTRLKRYKSGTQHPLVSFLVPARNEEANIRECVLSLLAQSYPNFEVLVLDDHSEDHTLAILQTIKNERLLVFRGRRLPQGWTGKNWACHQLAGKAEGEILFFADADTVFTPDALDKVVAILLGEKADFISGFPRQVLGSLGEKLLVPIFYWAFLSFTPLLVNRIWKKSPTLRANGQMMIFRRAAYDLTGGHLAVKSSVTEDLEIARRMRRLGLTCRIMDATRMISCRMYHNSREVYDGFTKDLFPAFSYAILPYAFVWLFLGYCYIVPYILMLLNWNSLCFFSHETALLGLTILFSFIQWIFTYWRLRLPVWPAFFYPVIIIAFEVMAVGSFVNSLRRKTTWKGRRLTRPPIRLI